MKERFFILVKFGDGTYQHKAFERSNLFGRCLGAHLGLDRDPATTQLSNDLKITLAHLYGWCKWRRKLVKELRPGKVAYAKPHLGAMIWTQEDINLTLYWTKEVQKFAASLFEKEQQIGIKWVMPTVIDTIETENGGTMQLSEY